MFYTSASKLTGLRKENNKFAYVKTKLGITLLLGQWLLILYSTETDGPCVTVGFKSVQFYELTLIISDRAAEQPKCYSGELFSKE